MTDQEELNSRIQLIIKRMAIWKAENTKIQKFLAIYDNAPAEPEKIEGKMEKYSNALKDHEETLAELAALDPDYEHHSLQAAYDIENDYLDNVARYEKLKAIDRGELPPGSRP